MQSYSTNQNKELLVITKAYDLTREMTQRARKLPRDVKFVLGDRMLLTAYTILDLVLEAKYTHEKRAILGQANLLLERLRFQVRLCMEERFMSLRQYEYVSGLILEVGRMVGGWSKAVHA